MSQTQEAIPIVVVLGPTASGKTALAVQLAREFSGEIISQDSRQVFRGMDIGTAKPTPAERGLAPHHGLDLVAPDETWTLAEHQRMTYETVERVHRAGRLPLLVGGTGQYLRAVLEGWTVPPVAPDAAFRYQLADEAKRYGVPT
ncbi:MAG: tRNA (adenosine(37)-N6)-dimethylallyltransferase MiaA, partial [Chloroflexota bacterium]|nr:tRNA (adenosine(37)-N6)-dimethylallyltransferase MiaA [Chloroflexota bacterium]